jgi:hypothetical protein
VHEPDAPTGARRTFVQVVKTEEKGSDVNIATYLVLDACRQDCAAAVLVTNDSDLKEPLRVARDELGIVTGVVNPHPANRRSRALDAIFFKQIRESALRQCQFPATVTDATGNKIHKPVDW